MQKHEQYPPQPMAPSTSVHEDPLLKEDISL